MISVEGYTTLSEFHLAAQRSIRVRLQADRQALADEREQPHRELSANVAIAAKFLVFDLFRNNSTGREGNDVYILRPDGTRARLDLKLMAPAEELVGDDAFEKARLEFFGDRWGYMGDGVFGLKSLRSNYWHSAFLTTKVFRSRERRLVPSVRDITRYTPVVDWQTSTISLTDLRVFARAMDLINQANAGFSALGIEMGIRALARGADTRIGTAAAILEMMSPYEGHIVVAPSEWVAELFDDLRPQSVEERSMQEDRAPKDMIVEFYRGNASMTREEIKEALFPEMSARQFDRHWKQATDAAPELKRPGRRSAKS